jgi:GT2 family glycosyltransferase
VSIRVVDLEASVPLPVLELGAGVSGLLALVRWHGQPAGLLRLQVQDRVPAQALQAAIEAQVPRPPPLPVGAGGGPVSIVVCTRDRPQELDRCLRALRVHAAAGHEVIVVDNAPSDGSTAKVVASHGCRYLCEPEPGLNRARNRGFAAAHHDLVAFTDDDCAPDPGWVEALVAPYADAEVAATTGLVMPLELETAAQESFEAYSANRRIFEPRLYRRSTTPPSAAGVAGLGANMSFRRATLVGLGGFDPRFDGGTPTLSGGDTEMFARLLGAGGTIAYRPDALVWHRHRRDLPSLRRVVFGYGAGVFAVFAKRLAEDRDIGVLLTAPRWLLGPPLKAAWNALRGRPATPAGLVAAELWGALHGPWRYLVARRAAPATRSGG